MDTRRLAIALAALVVPLLQSCEEAANPVEASAALGAEPAAYSVDQGSGPVYRFKQNGAFAFLTSYDPESGTSLYLDVGRDDTGPDGTTWLFYFVDRCFETPDGWFECQVLAAGGGTIASQDLRGSANNRISLNTDTRTNPGFETWAGAPGIISLEWEKTPYYGFRQSGHNETRWFGTTFRSSGNSRESSATAAGTVVGYGTGAFSDGYIGTRHNVELVFERGESEF